MPSPQQKLDILQMTNERLQQAGYVYIGMDHFAKPGDELAQAQREGHLYRNFQGYSTHADCDLVGLGMTSIGKVGNSYSQNMRTMAEYCAAIDAGHLPLYRGVELDKDDLLRREIITELMCNFALDTQTIAAKYEINFAEYFAVEQSEIAQLQQDGLITIAGSRIAVQPAGRFLIRNVCMVFDKYLRQSKEQRFSKVI